MPKLFDRFMQADARPRGATAARAWAGDQPRDRRPDGRRIDVDSAVGVGSTFRVVLPMARGDARRLAAAESTLHGAPTCGGLRILVAEDNGVNQILIKAILDQMGHFSDIVATASRW
jgi:hypothetical protein